jgi:Zn-dependent dipeptidase, microsomal dipeptidase homolog
VPEGLEDISKLPKLSKELLDRGYSASEVGNIMGGNFIRVMEKVQKLARA